MHPSLCTKDMSVYIKQNSSIQRFNSSDSWPILSPIEEGIKRKIEAIGKPLKDWDVQINYGIKTGFNEAFIISRAKRDEIIAADPKSAEIIRPILRGRDIKRYGYTFADLWVILAKFGSQKYLENEYPAIFRHLEQYENKLKQRGQCRYTSNRKINTDKPYPGQHHWLELDNNPSDKYLDDFSKQKIIWGNLCLNAQYAFAEEQYFISAPATMIVPGDKYLLAVLNSKLADFYIHTQGVTRSGGYFEYKPMFIERIPLPILSEEAKIPFTTLVEKICNNMHEPTSFTLVEQEIDMMICELFKLNDVEKNYILSLER